MPYTMTHLCVGKEFVRQNSVRDLEQFYLGSIAPDSIHHCKDTVDFGEIKKRSHFCDLPEAWTTVKDNTMWAKLAVNGYMELLSSKLYNKNHDYLLGYIVHVLTDIYWNMSVFSNYKHAANQRNLDPVTRLVQYRKESLSLNTLQYNTMPDAKKLLEYVGLADIKENTVVRNITPTMLNTYRSLVLDTFYNDTEPVCEPTLLLSIFDQDVFVTGCIDYVTQKLS